MKNFSFLLLLIFFSLSHSALAKSRCVGRENDPRAYDWLMLGAVMNQTIEGEFFIEIDGQKQTTQFNSLQSCELRRLSCQLSGSSYHLIYVDGTKAGVFGRSEICERERVKLIEAAIF